MADDIDLGATEANGFDDQPMPRCGFWCNM